MGPLFLASAGIQGLTSIFAGIQGAKMMKEAKKINPYYTPYQTSEYAKNMLGLAQTRLNSRNPYAAARDRMLQQNQANTNAYISKGAVDPAQAMEMYLKSQAQSNLAGLNANMQDANYDAQNVANYFTANNAMTAEGDKVYNDMFNKYQLDMNQKNALRQAGMQSIVNAGTSLASNLASVQGLKNADNANKNSAMSNALMAAKLLG